MKTCFTYKHRRECFVDSPSKCTLSARGDSVYPAKAKRGGVFRLKPVSNVLSKPPKSTQLKRSLPPNLPTLDLSSNRCVSNATILIILNQAWHWGHVCNGSNPVKKDICMDFINLKWGIWINLMINYLIGDGRLRTILGMYLVSVPI